MCDINSEITTNVFPCFPSTGSMFYNPLGSRISELALDPHLTLISLNIPKNYS